MSLKILPLYDAPHFADQVTDWLWQAFGDTLSRDFFASVVAHSQQPEALPVTFIATEGGRLLGTVGLWRCDLPGWQRCMLMRSRAGRGSRAGFSST